MCGWQAAGGYNSRAFQRKRCQNMPETLKLDKNNTVTQKGCDVHLSLMPAQPCVTRHPLNPSQALRSAQIKSKFVPKICQPKVRSNVEARIIYAHYQLTARRNMPASFAKDIVLLQTGFKQRGYLGHFLLDLDPATKTFIFFASPVDYVVLLQTGFEQ